MAGQACARGMSFATKQEAGVDMAAGKLEEVTLHETNKTRQGSLLKISTLGDLHFRTVQLCIGE